MQAVDGSTDERGRFLSSARGPVAVCMPLSAAALGAVFGRDRAVHVVVARGALAERIGVDCTRLAGLAPSQAANDKASAHEGASADEAASRDAAMHDRASNDEVVIVRDGNLGAKASRSPI